MNQAIATNLGVNVGLDLLRAGGESTPLPDDHPNSQANIERRYANKLVERLPNGQLLKGSVVTVGPRPKGQTVTTLARNYTDRAIDLLGKVMDDEKAPQAARVTAAQALLDRGWGKAPIQIDLNVRAKFDDFLRDVGLAANYERDHPVVDEQHGPQTVEDVVIKSALDEDERKANEQEAGE